MRLTYILIMVYAKLAVI